MRPFSIAPLGEIKEKILAARRAKITDIILSEENRKDVLEIDEIYRESLKFHYVDTMMDAVGLALAANKSTKA